jgi:dTDP-D-glucose 4,6-dehydratase
VRDGEIFLLNSSHAKLTERTGWKPSVEIDEGLDRTIEIWKDIIANNLPFNNNTKFSRGK